jgi:Flp pilus assembly protein TadG
MFKRILKGEKGAVLLESVYGLVFLLVLTSFMLTAAVALYNWIVIEDASRDAARQVALGSNTSDVQTIVTNLAGPIILGKNNFTVTTTDLGDKIQVTTSYKSVSFLPGMNAVFGGSPWAAYIQIPATATFKKET